MALNFLNTILDASILFSFDRTGFERHAKNFEKEKFDGSDKTALVTGANSGLGYAITKALCKHGVNVHMICRDEVKGNEAIKQLTKEYPQATLKLHILDLSEKKNIVRYCEEGHFPDLDILINNAGLMPETLTYNSEGEEISWATQVDGHYILTESLIRKKLLKEHARVITVSSGGMYLQKLDLSDLDWNNREYNKYTAYSNAKRAQVMMNHLWHEKYGRHITFSCMHPGWAETKGVKKYMPSFYRWMQKRLRTPEQGVDTILWLALTEKKYPGGKFWFDRTIASEHFFSYTKESEEDRKSLQSYLESHLTSN